MLPERHAAQVKEAETLPRCCRRHDSCMTLTQHIIRDFTDVITPVVLTHVQRARQAVAAFRLPLHDELEMAEPVVRSQLSLLTGRVGDAARLDPRPRARRSEN